MVQGIYNPDVQPMMIWALYPPNKRPKIIGIDKEFGHVMKLKVKETDPLITASMGVNLSKFNSAHTKFLVKERNTLKQDNEQLRFNIVSL